MIEDLLKGTALRCLKDLKKLRLNYLVEIIMVMMKKVFKVYEGDNFARIQIDGKKIPNSRCIF